MVSLAKLALPISASRVGQTAMLAIDSMMVGHYGTDALAGFAFGSSVVQTMQIVGLGLLMGGMVEISAAVGRGRLDEAGAIWRRSLVYALAIGLVGLLLATRAPDLLLATGLSAELAERAGRIAMILAGSLPPMLVYIASVMLLEGLGRPAAAVWIMAGANLVNLALDAVLVFGFAGIPALGAEGAALGTLAVRIGVAAAAVGFIVWRLPERTLLGRPALSDHAWAAGRRQRRMGVAEGLSMGIESGAFATMTLFAGWAGARELAAYTIAINVNMLLFMIAVGIGGATTVRVAQARGRDDPAGMFGAAWMGFAVFGAVALAVAIALAAQPGGVLALYTRDPVLAALAVPMIMLIGPVHLVDGMQRLISNVLRGYGETWLPTASHLLSYVVVMVPVGHWLCIGAGFGAYGLVLAIGAASLLATGLLFARFLWLSRRPTGERTAPPLEA
ncbi:MATE family efflux transporter [Azospirillum canadense]|uniref:MATE family efflux transporter n=1 Tax=Azospirillum canadense TaxID=403962 RepID=UPI002227B55D|nr:MATE family efflux transporter [Azospirillum canadense]MCW2238856.1 MATE family multidrug resistance protein [Azospirillum canadense]